MVDKVAAGVPDYLNNRFKKFEQKLDKLQKSLTTIENNFKKDLATLDNKVDELEKKIRDSTGNSRNVYQVMSEINKIKRRENNVLLFGLAEDVDVKSMGLEIMRKNYSKSQLEQSSHYLKMYKKRKLPRKI
ncbi:hypothetical protein JTB14_033225 [Gonioctena quinquepunctata]|nr:hypothetical protein JTB14_033225 [Gonioctena quinquepunctata]